MIYSLHTNYKKDCPSSFHMVNTEFGLRDKPRKLLPEHIEFKPGLNIIVGGNGSGKSTLLKALWANSLQQAVPDSEEFSGGEMQANEALSQVFQTGSLRGAFFLSEEEKANLRGKVKEYGFFDIRMDFNAPVYKMDEISSFSNEKAMASFSNFGDHFCNMHSSKGEKLIRSFNRFAQFLNDDLGKLENYSSETLLQKILFPSAYLSEPILRKYINKHHQEGEYHQPTLIMDEVDAGLDIFGLNAMKDWLKIVSRKFQIIVVLHNSTLIESFKDTAHFIELTDNYMTYLNKFNAGKKMPSRRPKNQRDIKKRNKCEV